MKKIVLIGGAPTNGKSFIARRIADELQLPWISTDTIREMMRKIVRKNDYPNLFHFSGEEITAEKYLSTHSPQQIVDSQNLESMEVWKGVRALVETNYAWDQYIIEGVAVLPELVAKLDRSKYEIMPVFLVDENESRVRDVVYTRGLWDDASKYSDDVKDIEVEWTMLFSRYIRTESEKYGFKVYKIEDRAEFIDRLIEEVRDWLAEDPLDES